MKKRLLSAILTAAVTLSALTAVPAYVTAEEAVPVSSVSAESEQTKNYWIFYKNIDTTEIDNVVRQKVHDYEYSLYDTEKDARTIERLVTDYYQSMRLEMLKEAFAEKSAEILTELGVEPSAAWCSKFTPSIVCPLTEEQYEKAAKMDSITDISSYEPAVLQPLTLTEKDDILNEYTRNADGKSLCDDNVRFDVVFGAGPDNNTNYLVVYGLKSENEIKTVKKQLADKYHWDTPTMELYSGVELSCTDQGAANSLKILVFVQDQLPGFAVKDTIGNYSAKLGFDVSPYIISLGDSNGDFRINAADASDVLSKYTQAQTTGSAGLSAAEIKKLDVDGDGTISALDASAILSYYAYTATGGIISLRDYLKK